jgi:type IV secretory pathway VirB6-like protein
VNLLDPTLWHLFTGLWQLLEVPLEAGVNGAVTALSAYVVGPFRAWVLVYLIGTMLIAAWSPSDDAAMGFFRHLFRAGFVYMIIAYAANFNFFFGNLFLHTLPDGIGNALSGTPNAAGFGPAIFDKILVQGFSAGVAAFKLVPWFSFKGLALAIVVILYWGIVAVSVGWIYLIYLAAHAAVALLIAGGPLFVALRMFPATSQFFNGWISALMSAVVVQIFSVILLSVVIAAETHQLHALAAMAAAGVDATEDNIMGVMFTLTGAGLVFAIGAWLSLKLSAIGSTIASGVYWNAEAVGRMAADYVAPGAAAVEPMSGGGNPAAPIPAMHHSFQSNVGAAP